MEPLKIHQFDPVIYPRKLWVAISGNEKAINERFDVDFDSTDDSEAYVFPCTDKETRKLGVCCVFRRRKYLTVRNIAHESVHIASVIFDACSMTMGFSDDKDEHFAYLVGWAADCIEQVKYGKFKYDHQ